MYSKMQTRTSTRDCWDELRRLKEELERADAVLVGIGSGLSTAAGLTYSGPRFQELFGDFIEKYHLSDMYSAGFYPFPTEEEKWAYWSRHIDCNRYHRELGQPFYDLKTLLEGREYFIITTNVDHCLQDVGIDKKRLFYTQGDYGLWQCAKPCCQKTWDNREAVERMVAEQKEMRIPSDLVPRCPVCGGPVFMNLRCDHTFVEDEGWHAARARYERFLERYGGGRLLLLEMGVGGNTPGVIKYPFWKLTRMNPKAVYACLNLYEARAPKEFGERGIEVSCDLAVSLALLAGRTEKVKP